EPRIPQPIEVSPEFISQRLGTNFDAAHIQEYLQNVELTVADNLSVTPAFWRTDLELPEDIVEEVGRLYGYEKLPRELPKRSTKPTRQNDSRESGRSVRDILSRAGAN